MTIMTNSGSNTTHWIGDLPGYNKPIWFDPNGIANILSLSNVKKVYRVSFDSCKGNIFTIHKESGNIIFKQCKNGLYYHDLSEYTSITMVVTVKDKQELYINRQYHQEKLARKTQNTIELPSTRTYLDIVDNDLLKNCPVMRLDVITADDVFGPNVDALHGKTTRIKPNAICTLYQDVPRQIIQAHHNVTICGDLMFVNIIPFLITQAKVIKFGTVENFPSAKILILLASLKPVISIYRNGV